MSVNKWRHVTLSDVVSLQRGHDLPEPERIAGDVPVMGSFGLTGWHNTAKCKGPGVTVGRSGASFGVVGYTEKPYWPLNTALYVTDFHGNDERYVYYLLKTIDFTAYNTGSAQPSLNRNHLVNIPIDLPEPTEQRAIAAVLAALDDKIEQNRRTGRALETLAGATFKAWFLDFEPIKAKATGQNGFPGMPAAAFAAIPDRLIDSPLGPVPEGWAVRPIGDIAMLSKQQIDPQDHTDESFEHFSIPSFDAGQNPVIEPGGGIRSQKFVVVPGCVLLSKLNPRIARIWLPSPSTGLRQIASTEFLVVVPRAGWIRETIYCLFQQEDFRESLAQSASGTSNSHQRVRPGDLLARPIVAPSQPILDVFAEQVVPQMALREALHKESSKLAALRDYLLPRLLSGRVRVPSSVAEVTA